MAKTKQKEKYCLLLAVASICLIADYSFARKRHIEPNLDSVLDLVRSGATQVEDVISRIPASYMSSFTLAYDPRGAQEGSYDDPRAVVFGDKADFVFTYNGDPQHRGYHTIEMAQWRQETKEYEFRRLDFRKANPISEPNPELCMGCHDPSGKGRPRPIWDPYSVWFGYYGSDDDFFVDDDLGYATGRQDGFGRLIPFRLKELYHFSRFAKKMGSLSEHQRYRFLNPKPGSRYSPYLDVYQGDNRFRPNRFLSETFANRVAQQIWHNLNDHAESEIIIDLVKLGRFLQQVQEPRQVRYEDKFWQLGDISPIERTVIHRKNFEKRHSFYQTGSSRTWIETLIDSWTQNRYKSSTNERLRNALSAQLENSESGRSFDFRKELHKELFYDVKKRINQNDGCHNFALNEDVREALQFGDDYFKN